MGIPKKYTRQELIDEALRFQRENGRIPTKHDMMVYKGYPSFIYYEEVFGSWPNALKEIFDYVPSNCVRYTREELKLALIRSYNENGRIPQKREFTASGGYPCYSLYLLEFGSWNNAIKEVFGFVPERLVSLTKDEIKIRFQQFYKENGKIPTREDLKEMGMTYQQIRKTYGSMNEAINDIHFEGRIDPHFFSPENMNLWKWYIVGYIITDGNIYRNSLSITTHETDKENLYAIYKYLELDTSFLEVKGEWTQQYDHKYYRITKSCKQWKEDLELYGIVPRKAKIVGIPYWYIKTREEAAAVCRGIFDGDGSIDFAYRRGTNLYPIFTISGSKQVCSDYSSFLGKYCNVNCNVQECEYNFKIAVEGKECKKIYEFLYGHDNFYIKRKKDRFEQLVNGTFTKDTDPYYRN